jgi:hypothetical protein
MNLEDREAENTLDEIDGTSDGVSGQELASVRSLTQGEGGGWWRARRKRALFI